MAIADELEKVSSVVIRQLVEYAELFGVETRNKYRLETAEGAPLGFAAEVAGGLFNFLFRQSFGHWRPFSIQVSDSQGALEYVGKHPFRMFFQRVEVQDRAGVPIGAIQRRWGVLMKAFDVQDRSGKVLFRVRSPFWRIWTFEFKRERVTAAVIVKRWGGIVKEAFTDADRFSVEYKDPAMTTEEKLLVLMAGIYVDLLYFEKKAGS
jgi:hypothetical protein